MWLLVDDADASDDVRERNCDCGVDGPGPGTGMRASWNEGAVEGRRGTRPCDMPGATRAGFGRDGPPGAISSDLARADVEVDTMDVRRASRAETGMTTPCALRPTRENLGGAAWVSQFSSGLGEVEGGRRLATDRRTLDGRASVSPWPCP